MASSTKESAAVSSNSTRSSSSVSEENDHEKELDLNSLKQEIFLKILVLGDLGVGKSSLIRKYTGEGDNSTQDYKISCDPSYKLKQVELDGRLINIQLWDVPGHERFGGMTRVYYKYAHGALIAFDLSRPETFDSALSWLSDVTEKLFDEKQRLLIGDIDDPASLVGESNNPMPILLLANKSDLPNLKVSRQKYSSYVKEHGLLGWYETSASDPGSFSLAIRRLIEFIVQTDPTVRIARENANIWKKLNL